MWPDKVIRQFQTVPANPLESDFHGSYNKLLYTLFPVDSDYMLKDPGDLHLISTRELADSQIRQRMADQYTNCPIPTLYGISAMGTALCFYSLETKGQDAEIMPLSIPRHPTRINNTAPKDRWDLDILTMEGEKKFRAVVEEVMQACASL